MKKVFLLFGVAIFSSASAQQKDLFDIQQHLQKKQAEDKKAAEKIKLLLPPLTSFKFYTPYTTNKTGLSYTLPNGDKVVILGQDNMPCIVLDMNQFQTMPNVISGIGNPHYDLLPPVRKPGQIPNGALPFRMIVSK